MTARARPSSHLPVVLSVPETASLIGAMHGTPRLMASPILAVRWTDSRQPREGADRPPRDPNNDVTGGGERRRPVTRRGAAIG